MEIGYFHFGDAYMGKEDEPWRMSVAHSVRYEPPTIIAL